MTASARGQGAVSPWPPGETWQIVQHYGWPVWLFWLLVVVMLAAAVLNTAVQMISNAHTRHADVAAPAPAAEQR